MQQLESIKGVAGVGHGRIYIYIYIYTHMEMRPAIKYCQFLKQEPSIDARLDGIA